MRKVSVILLVCLFMLPVFSSDAVESYGKLGVSVDLACVQDVILGGRDFNATMDLRAGLSDRFQVRVPVSATVNGSSMMLEAGLGLFYYPWSSGPFLGLSLFQAGFTSGCADLDNMVSLNEVSLGWTFRFGPGLFVEPSLVVRDPSGTFTDEYSSLKGTFPCYTTYRFRLQFGWYFWR